MAETYDNFTLEDFLRGQDAIAAPPPAVSNDLFGAMAADAYRPAPFINQMPGAGLMDAMAAEAYRPAPFINQNPVAVASQERQPSIGRQFLTALLRGMASPEVRALSAAGAMPRFFGSTLSDIGRAQSEWHRGARELEIQREKNKLAATQEANRDRQLAGEQQRLKNDAEAERLLRGKIAANTLAAKLAEIAALKEATKMEAGRTDPRLAVEQERAKREQAFIAAERGLETAARDEAKQVATRNALTTLAGSLKNTWSDSVWASDWNKLALAIQAGDRKAIDTIASVYPENAALQRVVVQARQLLGDMPGSLRALPSPAQSGGAMGGSLAPVLSTPIQFPRAPDITVRRDANGKLMFAP